MKKASTSQMRGGGLALFCFSYAYFSALNGYYLPFSVGQKQKPAVIVDTDNSAASRSFSANYKVDGLACEHEALAVGCHIGSVRRIFGTGEQTVGDFCDQQVFLSVKVTY